MLISKRGGIENRIHNEMNFNSAPQQKKYSKRGQSGQNRRFSKE